MIVTNATERKIIRNMARCLKCGDIIESHYRHDFVECECGEIFVDGGTSYLRRGGDPDKILDMSVYEEDK